MEDTRYEEEEEMTANAGNASQNTGSADYDTRVGVLVMRLVEVKRLLEPRLFPME